MPIQRVLCCFSVALLLVVSGCHQQALDHRAADESAIRALDAQWSKTAGAHDLDGIVSYYSDDAVLLPPNAPVATGRQEPAKALAAVPKARPPLEPTMAELKLVP